MNAVLCLARQDLPWKMDGETLPAGRSWKVWAVPGTVNMVGSAPQWNCQFRRRFANVPARSATVFCKSVSADRIVMAASR